MASEFEKYARLHRGISSLKLHDFQSVSVAYVSPTIIEERQLNVAAMDVFSRLMMDRIIFLGHQLPRGFGLGRAGDLRHDAARGLRRGDHLHGPCGVDGRRAAHGRG